jgi:hypothetical protein
MTDVSRNEHVQWAKQRALEELNADPNGSGPLNALTSLMSDLKKHPETAQHHGIDLTMMLLMSGHLIRPSDVHEHIEGFK